MSNSDRNHRPPRRVTVPLTPDPRSAAADTFAELRVHFDRLTKVAREIAAAENLSCAQMVTATLRAMEDLHDPEELRHLVRRLHAQMDARWRWARAHANHKGARE